MLNDLWLTQKILNPGFIRFLSITSLISIAVFKQYIGTFASEEISDAELVELVYWRTLSRAPSRAELVFATNYLAHAEGLSTASAVVSKGRRKDRVVVTPLDFTIRTQHRLKNVQDLTWALLNAKEFVFRH